MMRRRTYLARPSKTTSIVRFRLPKINSKRVVLWNLLVLVLTLVPAANADFDYVTNNGAITIAHYNDNGSNVEVTIPDTVYGMPVSRVGIGAFFGHANLTSVSIPISVTDIDIWAFSACAGLRAIAVNPGNLFFSSVNGVLFNKNQTTLIQYPAGLGGLYTIPGNVTSIGESGFEGCDKLTDVKLPTGMTNIGVFAFNGCSRLTAVTIPKTVTSIGFRAFGACTSLQEVYFEGNAPSADFDVIDGSRPTVFYLQGTTGWGTNFGAFPPKPWLPLITVGGVNFGVRTNQFGFNIAWAGDMAVVVEASSNPAGSAWMAVSTNATMSDVSYFSDPQWTNFSSRFYRLRSF